MIKNIFFSFSFFFYIAPNPDILCSFFLLWFLIIIQPVYLFIFLYYYLVMSRMGIQTIQLNLAVQFFFVAFCYQNKHFL